MEPGSAGKDSRKSSQKPRQPESVEYSVMQTIDLNDYTLFRCYRQDTKERNLIKKYRDLSRMKRYEYEKAMFIKCEKELGLPVLKRESEFRDNEAYYAVFRESFMCLKQYLDSKELSDREIMDVGLAIFKLIRDFNNSGIYLVNLSPKNLWVDLDEHNRLVFKVSDFLEASEIEKPVSSNIYIQKTEFTAPELIEKMSVLSFTKADLFSFGQILYTMKFPHNEKSLAERQMEVQSKDTEFSVDILRAVLHGLLKEDPRSRLNSFTLNELFVQYKKKKREGAYCQKNNYN